MTHTVHPYAHRLGVIRNWKSRWFAKDDTTYRENLLIDLQLRRFFKKRLRGYYVTAIDIERTQKTLRITIATARPGMVIGRGGENSVKLQKEVEQKVKSLKPKTPIAVKIDIEEVRSPESQAPVVAYMIAEGLEKPLPHGRNRPRNPARQPRRRDAAVVPRLRAERERGAPVAGPP